jgi:hypothetical protein
VLRTLEFTLGQLRGVIGAQSTTTAVLAMLVAVPVGVVASRLL